MFTDYHMVAGIKQQEATGQALDMADLRSAGTAITAPGGHCTEYGIPIPTITAPEEAQSFVDARIAEGSDYIKIIYETRTSPIGSESGLVSDFEDGTTHTLFGSGWAISTDSIRGGHSTAQYTVVPEGANGGKGSLLVSGEVASGMPFAWAGVIFYPGTTPGQPANLSDKMGLSFWAKGDGRTYSLMIYSGSFMAMPGTATFVAGPEWQEFRFAFSQFGTIDSHDVLGVSFTAGLIPGVFSFQIDDVRFTS